MNDKQYTQEMVKNLNKKLKSKQAALKFDNTPSPDSVNLVTSEGIKEYADTHGGKTYTAGDNIIFNNNFISAVDTKYEAGENVSFFSPINNINNVDVKGINVDTDHTTPIVSSYLVWEDALLNNVYGMYGRYIWTDGENIYYSHDTDQYVLTANNGWEPKTWIDFPGLNGNLVWTDGQNIYFSSGSTQYQKNGDSWTAKTWNGLTNFYGHSIWTDGENIYYSNNNSQYVLNKSTSTWEAKTWTGLTTRLAGSNVWTDGYDIYYSGGGAEQYILDKNTSTWNAKLWNGPSPVTGQNVWTDGTNIYYSDNNDQYIIYPESSVVTPIFWHQADNPYSYKFYGVDIWYDGKFIHYSNDTRERCLHNYSVITKLRQGGDHY